MTARTTRSAGETTERPPIGDRWTAAVHGREVVAVRVVDEGGDIEITHWRDGASAVERHTLIGLHGWVRAGRITMVTAKGSRVDLTLLGAQESAELRLGDHWPPYERSGRLSNLTAAATHQLGAAVRLDRTSRISGERNDALGELIARVRHAAPDVSVSFGSPFGHDQWEARLARGSAHKGVFGRHGDLSEL
jgi:hypothetical protein